MKKDESGVTLKWAIRNLLFTEPQNLFFFFFKKKKKQKKKVIFHNKTFSTISFPVLASARTTEKMNYRKK